MNIVPTSTTDEVVTITTLENTTICPKNQSSTAAPIPSYSPQGQHANNRSIAAPSTLAYPTPTESGVWSAGTVSFDSPAISSSTSLLTQTISTCIPTTIYSTIMAPQIASPPESSAPITTAYSVASVSSVSSQEWSISVATSSANSNFGISSDVTSPAATTPATSSSVEKPNFSYNGTSSVASSTGYMPYAPIASPSAPLQVSGARYVGVGNTLAILAFIFAVLV
ncbi:hypothetical protein BJ875DRAFT_496452 [Amylocarpus encephaloides]|uniref:Uncharacterized protein n=1 Tax=Amylocarpus encephaloides TaxID=45428 RepID=A0A9P8C655_9HELO|nr:hypothetical protein BJ875DRAFT_496452 [Amylocarpus encephaloides]